MRRTDAKQKEMLKLAFKETGRGDLNWIELAQNTVYWSSVLVKITIIIFITRTFVYRIKIHVDMIRIIYIKILTHSTE